MNDDYSEILVKRKPSKAEPFIRVVLIGGASVFVLAALMYFSPLFLIGAAVFVIAAFIIFPRLSVEYEYLYVDGGFDIDEIFSQSRRKRVKSFNVEGVELVAPVTSHRLDQYGKYKTVDYSEQNPDDTAYAVVLNESGVREKIIMQLNEQVLTDLKRRMPRKVFEQD